MSKGRSIVSGIGVGESPNLKIISTDVLVELLSSKSGNENVTQRHRDGAKGRRAGADPEDPITSAAVAPGAKSGWYTAE
ncbi:hypothetical protein NPIL_223841 [Nephila pilipes]|uniref:Uncharacterized protein n=1 Tax=Nephila pilipes TaxID=299642 RepID=A0A8X6TE07_NEPPI|nr:hypothetical protein NPIL_223841 [Nephila pilipes]